MNNTTNHSSYIKKLIISYSILLLVILVMGVYLYNLSISNVSKEIRNQNKFMLQKTVHDIDAAFTNMDVMAGQIVNNSNVVRLANKADNSENNFYLLAYHAQNDLIVYVSTESILPISSYYIFLKQPMYVLSGSQFQSFDLFYNGIRKYHESKYEEWLSMMNDPSLYRKFVPIDSFKSFSDSTYLYMMQLDDFSLRNVPATICFEIDYRKLGTVFSELNFYDNGYLCVSDADGNIAFSLEGDIAPEISLKQLTTLSYSKDFAHLQQNDIDMHITKVTSEYNGWTYYLAQPADDSLYSLEQYRDIFIAIILIGLLFEISLVLFLSKTNVKEVNLLGNELQSTITKQKDLQPVIETQKPLIMNSYLSKIIQGDISSQEELDYAQQYLAISTEQRRFAVLYMSVYVNQFEFYVDNSAVTGPDHTNYQEIIEQALYTYFTEPCYLSSSNEREYTILLTGSAEVSSEDLTVRCKDSFKALHEHLMSHYSIWAFAGLGDWNEGLMITWKSFQQATQAISYTTKRHTFRCYANLERDTGGFYYPIEMTRQLTNFITSGNQSQVLEIFEVIRQENLELRSLPMPMMKYLLSDIRNTLYKIRFTVENDDTNKSELHCIDNLFDQHMTLKLCEDIGIRLCQLFDKKSGGNELIATIKAYIDTNYQDPSLCLNKIADEFPISESYFSYLFKDEIGENFSSYLERKRMEHALRLLKETDLSVTQVYKEVGYNNPNTFRRVFKKIYHVAPTEIRCQEK